MSQHLGSEALLIAGIETTPGTVADSGTAINYNTNTIARAQGSQSSDIITSARVVSANTFDVPKVSGAITTKLQANDIGVLLKAAMGTDGWAAGASHPFTVAGVLPSLSIGRKFSGSKALLYTGCKIGSMSISAKPAGVPDLSFDLVGMGEAIVTSGLTAGLWTDDTVGTYAPFDSFGATQGTIAMTGSTLVEGTVLDVSLKLDNGVEAGPLGIGASAPASVISGVPKVTGSMTVMFDTADTMYAAAVARTAHSLTLEWTRGTGDGTAGNEKLTLACSNVMLEPTSPGVDGPKGVVCKYNFSSSGAGALNITLLNSLAAAY